MSKPLVYSYTFISTYLNCPRMAYERYVAKSTPYVESEQMKWGNIVHKAFEQRINYRRHLPESLTAWEPLCLQLELTPVKAEVKLGANALGAPQQFFGDHVWFRGALDVVKVQTNTAMILDWKGLALDTHIPYEHGWTTMGALKVGDRVYGTDGQLYPVIGKSEVKHLPCYEVSFFDHSIVCDNEHLWQLRSGAVVPVTELKKRDQIALPRPVCGFQHELPIDPYVLGWWLADGKHSSSEVSKPDEFMWEEVQCRGYELGTDTGASCTTRTVKGIRKHLHALGLYKNKHIPAIYLQASRTQRLDLLRGLMDGDGTPNKARDQVVFDVVDFSLAHQVAELARSLGERVLLHAFKKTGFGKTVMVHRACWHPFRENPFLLPRKREIAEPFVGTGRAYLEISEVKPCASYPTQCISVASPDNMYLCGQYVPTHNTGKTREDPLELEIFGLLLRVHYPEVEKVTGNYIWMQTGKLGQSHDLSDHRRTWDFIRKISDEIDRLRSHVGDGPWPEKQNGLCKAWCDVVSCPYNGKNK